MTLDDLILYAEKHTKSVLLHTKAEMPPSWFLHCPMGIHLVETPWNGDIEKLLARAFIRQVINEVGATSYSLAMEAWMVALPAGSRPIIDRPSQDPRRMECVQICATDGFNQLSSTLRMERDKVTGKCNGLVEFDELPEGQMKIFSPFLNLLTPMQ